MRDCPPVKIFTVAGNRDIGNFVARQMSWTGFEKQFMEPFYYFQFGERYYIFLDTQCYKLDFDYGPKMRKKQDEWLELLFRTLPRDAPKTVVMHTALFLEFPEEKKAKKKLKSLPLDVSTWLTELFSYNSVDTVFSGHVHFENFPEPVDNVRQVIMTSINALNTWHSDDTNIDYGPEFGNNERGYYVVQIKDAIKPAVQKIKV